MSEPRIFDLHCDTLDLLAWPTLTEELREGRAVYNPFSPESPGNLVVPGPLGNIEGDAVHLSLEGTRGMAWAQCLAVYVPDTLTTERQLDFFRAVAATLPVHAAAHPDRLACCRTVGEVEGALEEGRFAGVLTIEGAGLLAVSDDVVEEIDQAGVRMVTLTWNAANPLGSGHDSRQGLTDLGRRRVRDLERRRIAVDVSHLNDEGFADLLEVARRPFAASHSNSRAIHDVPRNLTDDQFRAIRDSGGVVGVNYYTGFVAPGDDYVPEQLMAHIDRWLDLGGQEVVALGSDFDGCDTPSWIASCRDIRHLAALLAERYGADLADKICYRNAADFFRRIERG